MPSKKRNLILVPVGKQGFHGVTGKTIPKIIKYMLQDFNFNPSSSWDPEMWWELLAVFRKAWNLDLSYFHTRYNDWEIAHWSKKLIWGREVWTQASKLCLSKMTNENVEPRGLLAFLCDLVDRTLCPWKLCRSTVRLDGVEDSRSACLLLHLYH